jgi:hypothetical protein
MKKIYFALLTFGALMSAQAQLTQANHAPANGDTFSTYQCDSVGAGASGAAVNWNFSVATHSSIQKTYAAASVTSVSYPMANVAVAANAGNSAYYNTSANSLLYYGGNINVGTVAANLNYTAAAIYATYPMSMGTTTNSIIGGSITVSSPLPANGTFTGTSTMTVDGTGTLTIAGMTYSNVTRVSVVQNISFVTNVAPGTLTENSFQFYQSGLKAPILTIETSTANLGLLGSPSQTLVQRTTAAPPTTTVSTVGISKNEIAQSGVQVYPNPANSELTIFCADKTAQTVSVYDITGKLVETKSFSSVWAKIDVSNYNQGLYIYRVNGENGAVISTGKVTVVH